MFNQKLFSIFQVAAQALFSFSFLSTLIKLANESDYVDWSISFSIVSAIFYLNIFSGVLFNKFIASGNYSTNIILQNGVGLIILSTLTGAANVGMDSFVPQESKSLASAIVGGVNIFAGIVSTLQNFLKVAELMEGHRIAGVSWGKLQRNIAIELALDPKRRVLQTDFLKLSRAEYDRLIEAGPIVDDGIIAQFNNSTYGRLSILANWRLKINKICDISPESFSPKPKIQSTLIHFTPKKNFAEINDPKNLEKITRIFFSHRRKMLKKPFNQIFNGNNDILNKLNIDLTLRPQNLDFDTYYRLAIEYEKLRG